MREIKFRAWDIIYKKWLRYFELTITGDVLQHGFVTGGTKLKDCIVEQFTGLVDKAGREIYEGDVCQTKSGTAVVAFSDRGGSFVWKIGGGATYVADAFRDHHDENIVEVIGNIHENPDLLKGETPPAEK